MNSAPDDAAIAALREWMRNERRLGIAHVGTPLPGRVSARPAAAGATEVVPNRAQPAPVASESDPAGLPRVAASAPPPRNVLAPRLGAAGSAPVRSAAAAPRPVAADPGELPPSCTRELDEGAAQHELATLDSGWVKGCARCGLHSGRKQTVFGVGHPRPELVFVGEGPGADEDDQGIPFVGRAGQLLTKMIGGMTLTREQVYICNVVKCRPPGNRTPTLEEMGACSPFLFRQLAVLRPKVIVTLGAPAGQTLLATKTPIGKLRGRFHNFPPPPLAALGLPECQLMPTFHPAYLLRSPEEKGKTWDDLKQVMRFLGLPVPGDP